jgi:hypothetical protein
MFFSVPGSFCRRLAVRNRLCIGKASDELLYHILGVPARASMLGHFRVLNAPAALERNPGCTSLSEGRILCQISEIPVSLHPELL